MRRETDYFMRYILDAQGEPVMEPDLLTWGRWFAKVENRRLAWDDLGERGTVSTVFLGSDHNFGGEDDARPLLWESMVFGGPLAEEMRRYHDRAEALAGHAALLEILRK